MYILVPPFHLQLKIVSKLKIYLSLLFLFPSDEQEKELEIKLDITKKSRYKKDSPLKKYFFLDFTK